MIARSHGKGMFSFVRNYQTVFQSDCTTLHSKSNEREFLLLYILSVFSIVSNLVFHHSNWYVLELLLL